MREVYAESSVWGMAPPDQNPVLREPTLEFLGLCRERRFLPHISDVVANEVRQAPVATQEVLLSVIADVAPLILPMPEQAEELAQRFIEQGILPDRRLDDARHVACALVNEMDLLVSWNYRHIANVRKAEAFNAVAVLAGLPAGLQIHTPLEVLQWE